MPSMVSTSQSLPMGKPEAERLIQCLEMLVMKGVIARAVKKLYETKTEIEALSRGDS